MTEKSIGEGSAALGGRPERLELGRKKLIAGAGRLSEATRQAIVFNDNLTSFTVTTFPKRHRPDFARFETHGVSALAYGWLRTVSLADQGRIMRDFDSNQPVVSLRAWIASLEKNNPPGDVLLVRIRAKDLERLREKD